MHVISNKNGYVHASFRSPTGSSGRFHSLGYYDAPATSVTLTAGSPTKTYGSSNNAYGAKVFLVSLGAGSIGGGTTGTGKITITGTSISDTGVRTASDSEIIVADIQALTANQYVESTKYWIGTVTYTIATTGDRTVLQLSFNYGFAKYFEFYDQDVIIDHFESTGRAGANDTGFNIQLLKHDGTGWTYSSSAFIPGGTEILNMNTDYVTEKNLANGKRFAYERYDLETSILSGSSTKTGVIVRITTSANNAVESMDTRLKFYYI